MATLQVRDIDDRLYELLRSRAKQQHRSISQEVIHIIEDYLSRTKRVFLDQTEAFLELSGAWEGEESAEDILRVIREGRTDSIRFTKNSGVFD